MKSAGAATKAISGGLRRRWRPTLYAVHRWAGTATGVLLWLMALSGFGLLLTDIANLRGHVSVPRGESLTDLGPALAEVAAARPGYALTNVLLPRAPGQSWIALLRQPRTDDRIAADLDPYTGRVLGYRDFDHTSFRVLLDLHSTFFAGTTGKFLATAMGAALVLLALSGGWLWRGAIGDLLRWRRRDEPRARWLHTFAGGWALALALLWGITGVAQMMAILSGTFAAAPRFAAADPAQLRALAPTSGMVSAVRALDPRAELVSFSPPSPGQTEVRFLLLRRGAWPWNKRLDAVFNAGSGRLLRVVRPSDMSAAERLNATIHALHFGIWGPARTLVLYCLGALLLATLPVTGLILRWRRW